LKNTQTGRAGRSVADAKTLTRGTKAILKTGRAGRSLADAKTLTRGTKVILKTGRAGRSLADAKTLTRGTKVRQKELIKYFGGTKMRNNKKVELQTRDINLFLHIYKARLLTSEEIRAIHFDGASFMYKRLPRLIEAGYIAMKSHSRQRYYFIKQQGVDELVSRRLIPQNSQAVRIDPLRVNVDMLINLGKVRLDLVKEGTINLDEWEYPFDVREALLISRFLPVCGRIGDIVVLHVCGRASKNLTSTFYLAYRLLTGLKPQAARVIILYETDDELKRLYSLSKSNLYVPIYVSRFNEFSALIAELLAGNDKQRIKEIMGHFLEAHPAAIFDTPLLGSVRATLPGNAQEILLVDGVSGTLSALQIFANWPRNYRFKLIRNDAKQSWVQD
jgi:hypothetical protein